MDSNDISGALSKILEDPAALAKAMSLASSLMGSMPTAAPEAKPTDSEPGEVAEAASEAVPTGTSPEGTGNTVDASPSIAAIAQMLGGGGTKGDPRCALLYALKPYMGHGRAEKIDTLVNMLRLADLAGGMLGGKLF